MPSFQETRRVALITGCSEPASIGSHLAIELLQKGWRVFATARKIATMSALGKKGCDLVALDVCSAESVAAAVDHVKKASDGRLDLLINNAGVSGMGAYLDTEPSAMNDMFDIHVTGPMRVTQGFASMLLKTAATHSKTTIINTGSVISHGMPFQAAYAATKAALQASSDVLRLELAPLGVRVITLELGLVQTAMTTGQEKHYPIRKPGASVFSNWDEIVQAVTDGFGKMTAEAPLPTEVAKQMVHAAESINPPGKLWLGASSNLFRFGLPLMPIRMKDNALSKQFRTDLIKRQK